MDYRARPARAYIALLRCLVGRQEASSQLGVDPVTLGLPPAGFSVVRLQRASVSFRIAIEGLVV